MRILLSIVLLCTALTVQAYSQRRSQQPRIIQPPTATEQQKAREEQRGTEQLPLIVKIPPTPKTDEERDREADERERIADSERKKEQSDADLVRYTAELANFTRKLFYATVVLGIATGGLLIAAFLQSRDTKASVTEARRAATAAQQASETARVALILTERPFVFISSFNAYLIGNEFHIMPQWQNSGTTPANPMKNYANWKTFQG